MSAELPANQPSASQPSADHIMQLGLAFWGSKALLSAVELGVFTELAKGPADAEQLQARLGLHARSARDFFDTLVALGMLERTGGRYTNTPESGAFLDRAKPSYLGGMLEMANARLYPSWGHLTGALKSGQPKNEMTPGGADPFAELYADPDRLKLFLSAMTGISQPSARAIAAKFPFANAKTFADVGCAQGGLPVQISLAHPHLRAVGYDLPQVRPVFEPYVESFGLADRVRFQPGNFLTDPLPSADVIVMGHILHDWDLPTKKMLLAKAHAALPVGGAVIVYESLIDDDRSKNVFGLLMSLNMLIETPGGFDYSGADCIGWMREAGFKDARVEHLAGPESMVVAIK